MSKFVYVVLVLVLAAGCQDRSAGPRQKAEPKAVPVAKKPERKPERKLEPVAKNPPTIKELRTRLLGMTEDEVIKTLGRPHLITPRPGFKDAIWDFRSNEPYASGQLKNEGYDYFSISVGISDSSHRVHTVW